MPAMRHVHALYLRSSFKEIFDLFFCVCGRLSACQSVHHKDAVPKDAGRERTPDSLELELYIGGCELHRGYLKLNPGVL